MTDAAAPSSGRALLRWGGPLVVVLGLIGAALVLAPGAPNLQPAELRPHAPDLSPILEASPAIKVHLGAALFAFVLGGLQLVAPKGVLLHRLMGWTWIVLMAVAAVSALFIRQLNQGQFSLIHILSVVTLVSLPLGVLAARRGNIAAHRRHMTGLFVGALVVAGALSFLPGRILWRVFFG